MHTRAWIIVAAAAAIVAVALAAGLHDQPRYVCADPLGCLDLAPGEPVKLGVIQSLSGKVASLGQEQIRGLELALARRGGKILSRATALTVEDTGCAPEGGANAALKIAADPKIAAVFGTTCSGDAATAAKVLSEAGLSMISGNNSAPYLTAIGGQKGSAWQPGYLRTAPNEETSGPAAARYAFDLLGLRSACTVSDGDIYTKGLADGFAREFTRLGGRVVLETKVNKADTDMGPVALAIRQSHAELVFFPLFQPEGNRLLRTLKSAPHLKKIVLMSDGALIDASFIADVGESAMGMYFVGPTPPPDSPALRHLEGEYRERYGVKPPTIYYASAFDAAEILIRAIEKAAVRDDDGNAHIGRQALRDALYATANFDGVSGRLACDTFGDCAAQRFNVLRLDDPAAGVDGLKANVVFTFAKSP